MVSFWLILRGRECRTHGEKFAFDNCFLGGVDFDLLVHTKGEVPFYDHVGHCFECGGGHVFGAFGGVPDVAHAAGHDGDNCT